MELPEAVVPEEVVVCSFLSVTVTLLNFEALPLLPP